MIRELVMHGVKYSENKFLIANWFMSEKLDGTRCLWDGGISRGMPVSEFPLANTRTVDGSRKKPGIDKLISTGLWTRYGNPIFAPDFFLDSLPKYILDGELWAGRGSFQDCRSYTSKKIPIDREWKQMQFVAYGLPSICVLAEPGVIKNSNCNYPISKSAESILNNLLAKTRKSMPKDKVNAFVNDITFETTYENLLCIEEDFNKSKKNKGYFRVLEQTQLPDNETEARRIVKEEAQRIVDEGGEGLMVRSHLAYYVNKRSRNLLKVKPRIPTTGTIVGFTTGKGRLLHNIGALIVKFKDKEFKLSGMADDHRFFLSRDESLVAKTKPGDVIKVKETRSFKLGQHIMFEYRELTKAGLPKEAAFKYVIE